MAGAGSSTDWQTFAPVGCDEGAREMSERNDDDTLLSMQPASVWLRRKRCYLNGYEG
jgi:hypothetical protein